MRLQHEVDHGRADRGERQDLPREIDLLDQVRVSTTDRAPSVSEPRTGSTPAGPTAGRPGSAGIPRFSTTTPKTNENTTRYMIGLSIDHADAQDRRLVLDLDFLAGEVQQDLAGAQDLPEAGDHTEPGRLGRADDDFRVGGCCHLLQWLLGPSRGRSGRGEPAGERPFGRSVTSLLRHAVERVRRLSERPAGPGQTRTGTLSYAAATRLVCFPKRRIAAAQVRPGTVVHRAGTTTPHARASGRDSTRTRAPAGDGIHTEAQGCPCPLDRPPTTT